MRDISIHSCIFKEICFVLRYLSTVLLKKNFLMKILKLIALTASMKMAHNDILSNA